MSSLGIQAAVVGKFAALVRHVNDIICGGCREGMIVIVQRKERRRGGSLKGRHGHHEKTRRNDGGSVEEHGVVCFAC